jgi:hypothetical protein
MCILVTAVMFQIMKGRCPAPHVTIQSLCCRGGVGYDHTNQVLFLRVCFVIFLSLMVMSLYNGLMRKVKALG